jgi:ribosome-associated translation inhibitor RaiA
MRRLGKAGAMQPSDGDDNTPVAIRSRIDLTEEDLGAIRTGIARKLGNAMALIERGTVRFDEIDDPKDGVAIVCRIKIVLNGRPALIAEDRAKDPQAAFDRAMPSVARSLAKARERDDLATRQRHRGRGLAKGKAATNERGATAGHSKGATYRDPGEDAGAVIGRRVGHGKAALARALTRPEKAHRNALLETADPGVSASERRAGGGSTARRNSKARPGKSKQVAALEDSRTKPSRKSTRRSATRTKQGTTKERTERGILYAPSSRHTTAR